MLGDVYDDATRNRIKVVAWTDGASTGGAGGWAAVIHTGWETELQILEIVGGAYDATSQRMEIAAVIGVLDACDPCRLHIVSDSKYVINSIGPWAHGHPDILGGAWLPSWRSRGWEKWDGASVANVDLWKIVWDLCCKHEEITFRHVRGHAGHKYNERADELAVKKKKAIQRRLKLAENHFILRKRTDTDG